VSATAPDPRAVAFALLQAVLRDRIALDDALDRDPGFAGLERRDRAFAHNLTATALRRLGQIDAAIDHCLERALPRSATAVRDLLRIGTAQLLFLRTPAHAAVDRTVALATGPRLAGFRNLVNAVLRRLGREGDALVAGQDAARLNAPAWLYDAWTGAYGADVAHRIGVAHLIETPLDLTAKADTAVWAGRLGARIVFGSSLRVDPGTAVAELPGFSEGAWWVQDAAAALPARVLLGGLRGAPNPRIADLCAAPGGKTAQFVAAGARVTAVDSDRSRLARLEENLGRLGLAADIVCADVAAWRTEEAFDGVLLDAPCTGTGTIRRHPDLPQLKGPADVARLAVAQSRLLNAAAALVRPGGVLVYSVCSLQPEEGVERPRAFLAAHGEFSRLPIGEGELGVPGEAITVDGDVQTRPDLRAEDGGMDGFHVARFRRTGGH
jgi:16S rRNA (cytosine967-C5)-methyltransferase